LARRRHHSSHGRNATNPYNVRNLLGLKPWYNYFISDERQRQNAIITHNFLAAASAILAGIGAALILLHDLTGPNAVSN
jgi:hypothetical protein